MKKYFVILLSASLFIFSCKKEEIELLTQQVDSHTSLTLNTVFFVDDSIGYACGGEKYGIGILLKTFDGGRTWSTPDSVLPKEIYAQYFFDAANGFLAGFDTWLARTSDSGKTFSSYASYEWETRGIAFGDALHGVRVNGSGYADGRFSFTNDGGNSWRTSAPIANSLRCVVYSNATTVFACGYGVIYKSTDAGEHFFPLDVRGDFFVAADFPSPNAGYFAGFQRMILKTTDGGNSFTKVMKENQPFSKREYFEAIDFFDDNNGFVAGVAGVMYQTTNGGASWKKIKPFTNVTLRHIHLFGATSGIVVGDNGKIFLFRN